MIKLLEYQVKEILRTKGVQTPAGVLVRNVSEMTVAMTKKKVMVKAQLPVSSRKKKSLIREASSLAQAKKEAFGIFHRAKKYGECHYLLIEEKNKVKKEMYLSVYSDPSSRGPVIYFHPEGGVEIETTVRKKSGVKLDIDITEGLSQDLWRERVSGAHAFASQKILDEFLRLSKDLYDLYREWDASFIEVNPFGVSAGRLVVLDAKMGIDEDALFRLNDKKTSFIHELNTRESKTYLEEAAAKIDAKDYRGLAYFVQNDIVAAKKKYKKKIRTIIGFNGVGTGASLTAMDELVRNGFFPRNFCDTSGNPPASKLYRITRIILSQPDIQGYFFVSCMSSQQLDNTARGIIKAFKEKYGPNGGTPDMPTLLHFRGAWDQEARQLFEEHGFFSNKQFVILGRESSERDAVLNFMRIYDKARRNN